jgi:hypothetical protein
MENTYVEQINNKISGRSRPFQVGAINKIWAQNFAINSSKYRSYGFSL